MRFSSAEQELFLKENNPEIWQVIYEKGGHHPEFKTLLRKNRRRTDRRKSRRKRKHLSKRRN